MGNTTHSVETFLNSATSKMQTQRESVTNTSHGLCFWTPQPPSRTRCQHAANEHNHTTTMWQIPWVRWASWRPWGQDCGPWQGEWSLCCRGPASRQWWPGLAGCVAVALSRMSASGSRTLEIDRGLLLKSPHKSINHVGICAFKLNTKWDWCILQSKTQNKHLGQIPFQCK